MATHPNAIRCLLDRVQGNSPNHRWRSAGFHLLKSWNTTRRPKALSSGESERKRWARRSQCRTSLTPGRRRAHCSALVQPDSSMLTSTKYGCQEKGGRKRVRRGTVPVAQERGGLDDSRIVSDLNAKAHQDHPACSAALPCAKRRRRGVDLCT